MSIVVTKDKSLYKSILAKIPGCDHAKDLSDMEYLLDTEPERNMVILDEVSLTKPMMDSIIKSIITYEPQIKHILIIAQNGESPDYQKTLKNARYNCTTTNINFFKDLK